MLVGWGSGKCVEPEKEPTVNGIEKNIIAWWGIGMGKDCRATGNGVE
jgi:hypothetical protein